MSRLGTEIQLRAQSYKFGWLFRSWLLLSYKIQNKTKSYNKYMSYMIRNSCSINTRPNFLRHIHSATSHLGRLEVVGRVFLVALKVNWGCDLAATVNLGLIFGHTYVSENSLNSPLLQPKTLYCNLQATTSNLNATLQKGGSVGNFWLGVCGVTHLENARSAILKDCYMILSFRHKLFHNDVK